MIKLLLCLAYGFGTAVVALQLRQQQVNLQHETARLQREIEAQQAKLWNQQLQIAIYTAPNAIRHTVGQHELSLVPETSLPQGAGDWIAPPRH